MTEQEQRLYFFIAVLAIIAIAFIFYFINKHNKKMIQAYAIKQEYNKALASKNKPLALKLGREYYGMLRYNGILTIYDEQAIANDLASI